MNYSDCSDALSRLAVPGWEIHQMNRFNIKRGMDADAISGPPAQRLDRARLNSTQRRQDDTRLDCPKANN